MKRQRSETSSSDVILVIGAASLDRLLTIPKFPAPDEKIRSTDYNEVCGGNAANSAATIARLTDAKCWRPKKKIVVKLLTKIGNDDVGKKVMGQLQDSNVDLSSPLFKIGSEGSTTSVCTILVDSEAQTRTCIFTLGSCGELSLEDVQSVNLDTIFENVIHLHSDTRHTDVALALVQEAKNRGIPVSLDCEKDRKNPSFDKLLEISDMVFMNSSCLELYLERLEAELYENQSTSTSDTNLHQMPKEIGNVILLGGDTNREACKLYIRSLWPNAFLCRWYPNPRRQCIITHGSSGALHFRAVKKTEESLRIRNIMPGGFAQFEFSQNGSIRLEHAYRNTNSTSRQDDYRIHQIGVLKNVDIVDTTGAGDAFIGAFLLATYSGLGKMDVVQDAMNFATWVSGKKLEGVGAQTALPRGADVDQHLGINWKGVVQSLHSQVGQQFHSKVEDKR